MNSKVINLVPVLAFVILASLFIANSNLSLDSARAATSDSQASLTLDTVLDISAPSTITLNCTPGSTDATSQLCTSNATVSVSTNNVTGYTLQLNATSGSSNSLTNTGITPNATIPTLSQAYASANFPVNYWGYTGGLDKSGETGGYNCATNYCPILAYQSTSSDYAPNHTIKVTDAPANNSSTTLTFGAKVNTTKPSGTYTTSITFTAVANALPAQPIQNGMDMQDIDSEVCAVTPLYSVSNTTYTVVDSRDTTNYTVAKLEDGNCWMTQNLALGGSTAINLTQADSNVGPSGFTLPASVVEGDWSYSLDDPEFFDYAGNYNDSTTKYGNHYNWSAATAGSDTSDTTNSDAAYSICPKNWRLPNASGIDAVNSEFYVVLNNYITTGTWYDGEYWTGITFSQITNAPLALVFSGVYAEYPEYQDVYGAWWSSTAVYYGTGAFMQSINTRNAVVYPMNDEDKNRGLSVRCLVPGA